jgi:IS1 family transposase
VSQKIAASRRAGDVWTWVAIDADTKLVCSWLVGDRDAICATEFIHDLAGRLRHRVQLTTDGLKLYLEPVEDAFGAEIDYAILVKLYGRSAEPETRYSPAKIIGCQAATITGDPDFKHVSTSYVERQNLTMRMSMRRFTRLTNGFSKKFENHAAAVAIHYLYYNFCRIHQTLRVTPAMQAGVSNHVWDVSELVGLLDVERSAAA